MKDEKIGIGGRIFRLLILAIILTAIIVFLLEFKLERLTIKPGSYYTAEQIEELLFTKGTDKYTALFAFRINHLWKEKIPFVEKIDVEMTDRNTAVIYVYDKAIIGCVEHMGSYVYFDREGIPVDSTVSLHEGIPLIKGLSFSDITLGRKLDFSHSGIFEKILSILMLLDKNGIAADDITFGLRDDIILHIGDDEILLGTADSYDVRIGNIPNAIAAVGEGSYRFDFRNYDEEHLEIDVRRLE